MSIYDDNTFEIEINHGAGSFTAASGTCVIDWVAGTIVLTFADESSDNITGNFNMTTYGWDFSWDYTYEIPVIGEKDFTLTGSINF